MKCVVEHGPFTYTIILPNIQTMNYVRNMEESDESFKEYDDFDFTSSFQELPAKLQTLERSIATEHSTFNYVINNLFENPEERLTNFRRLAILVYTAFEAYRTLISSYLIVFVPQNCGGYSCSIVQNLTPRNDLEIAAISLNTLTAFYFCLLFYLERSRENTINLHLVSDKKSPTDKEYLMQMIQSMEELPRRKIMRLNNWYRRCSQIILLLFFANAGLSYLVIYKNYLNNTTVTVFITNALFMINRIYKALKLTSSGEYNIYSAYRQNPILYNRDRSSWLKIESAEMSRYDNNIPLSF